MSYNNGTKVNCSRSTFVFEDININIWNFKINLVEIIDIRHTELHVFTVLVIVSYEVLKKKVVGSSCYCI